MGFVFLIWLNVGRKMSKLGMVLCLSRAARVNFHHGSKGQVLQTCQLTEKRISALGRVFGLTLALAVTPTEVLVSSVQHGV